MGIKRKCSRAQKEKGSGDAECEGDVIRVRLMCVQRQENLHHRGNAATDWSKRSKAECYDEYDYSGDLQHRNGNSCIDDAIADKHPGSTHAQDQEPAACRASGEHREQSLHGFTVTGARVGGESHKEVSAISPFEGG